MKIYASLLSLAAVALLAATPRAAEHPPLPLVKEGATVRISRHVYLIPDEKVPMVPNVGIVVGSRGALVVDPGMGRRSGEAVLREVAKVSKGGELYLVNTHFHPEHTTGEAAFPAHAKILRAAAQQQDVEEMGMKWVENFSKRSAGVAGLLEGFRFRKPAEIFEREKTLDLGGVRARIIRLGPGHTRGDTVVFVEGDGVLFSGDLAMKDIFPAFATPQSSGRTWLESLEELEKLEPRTVIGAHYPMGDAAVIREYRDFLRSLQARVAELKKQGRSSDETAEQVRTEFARKYPAWAQPIRIHRAAVVLYEEAAR